jgi:hypothetical protein
MAINDNLEFAPNFNNDWTDASGNGLDGSAIGATFSSGTKKLGSHSSAYDGTDDAGNFLNVLNSVFAGADKKFSFAFWLYFNNLTANQRYFAKLGDTTQGENQRQFHAWVQTDGAIALRIHFDLLGNASRKYETPASVISAGGWQLVRITYDGSIDTNDGLDRVTMKVDDVDKTVSMTPTGALGDIPSGTARVSTGGYIGSSGSVVSGDMDGFIDTGGVWSRILTSDDDDDLWNGGAGIELPIVTAGFPFFFGGQSH